VGCGALSASSPVVVRNFGHSAATYLANRHVASVGDGSRNRTEPIYFSPTPATAIVWMAGLATPSPRGRKGQVHRNTRLWGCRSVAASEKIGAGRSLHTRPMPGTAPRAGRMGGPLAIERLSPVPAPLPRRSALPPLAFRSGLASRLGIGAWPRRSRRENCCHEQLSVPGGRLTVGEIPLIDHDFTETILLPLPCPSSPVEAPRGTGSSE
jgi:hypothetical protein